MRRRTVLDRIDGLLNFVFDWLLTVFSILALLLMLWLVWNLDRVARWMVSL